VQTLSRLSPDDIHPAAIEAVFRTALISVDDHEPFGDSKQPGRFACYELGLPVIVSVEPRSKLITFQIVVGKPKNLDTIIALHTETLNSLMAEFPMIRVVSQSKQILLEYYLCGDAGMGHHEMIATFRRFVHYADPLITTLRDVANAVTKTLAFLVSSLEPPKPAGKDYETSNMDSLMAELIHGKPSVN
jgi:hypothetical protein